MTIETINDTKNTIIQKLKRNKKNQNENDTDVGTMQQNGRSETHKSSRDQQQHRHH